MELLHYYFATKEEFDQNDDRVELSSDVSTELIDVKSDLLNIIKFQFNFNCRRLSKRNKLYTK